MPVTATAKAESGLEAPTHPPGQPSVPTRSEWIGVLVLLVALFSFNLATYNYYPAVWCDDVSFSEPAINLVKYGSFTTLVWQYQPPNTFPVVNCPLYTMTLASWLSVLGTSLLAVRSFNYLLMAIAAFLAWQVSWRFNLVKSAFARLILVVLLHLGYGITHAYRCSRPDVIGMISLLLLVLAFRIKRPPMRAVCIALLSAVTVWIGLQVALYACFAWFLCSVIVRRNELAYGVPPLGGPTERDDSNKVAIGRLKAKLHPAFWREGMLMAGGMALGAGTLALFMYSKGVLREFLGCTTGMFVVGMRSAGSAAGSFPHTARDFVRTTIKSYPADFSAAVIMVGLVAMLLLFRKRLTQATRQFSLFALGLFFGVPALFTVVGHYGFYYSYMIFGPTLLALLAICTELGILGGAELSARADSSTVIQDSRTMRPRSYARVIGFGTLIVAASLGLPMRLVVAVATCKLAPRADLQRIIGSQMTPQDIVMTEYRGFFEAKQVAQNVYDPWSTYGLMSPGRAGHEFTPEEKAKFTVLIIPPEDKKAYFDFFGGQWVATCEPFGDTQEFGRLPRLPVLGRRFASYAGQPQVARVQLQVFRRSTPVPRATP